MLFFRTEMFNVMVYTVYVHLYLTHINEGQHVLCFVNKIQE